MKRFNGRVFLLFNVFLVDQKLDNLTWPEGNMDKAEQCVASDEETSR